MAAAATRIIDSDLVEHPAAVAWRRIAPRCGGPSAITVLKDREHSKVYRLKGAGPRGAAVIAKRCRPEGAEIERTIYEKIFPALQITTLHIYGCFGEDGESAAERRSWLFLEDADGENYSYALDEHRALAGRWLGAMHSSAALNRVPARLPDRGPGYYLEIMRSVREAIHRRLADSTLNVDDPRVLDAIIEQYEIVESHWDQIMSFCDRMPRTLVHGDLAAKNARVRISRGLSLVVMDWETAGWGVPAVDLAQFVVHSLSPDLAAYSSMALPCWTDATNLAQMVEIGKIFRCIASASWATFGLFSPWWIERSMRNLKCYQAAMADCLRNAEWGK